MAENEKKKLKYLPFSNWLYLVIVIVIIGLIYWYISAWKQVKEYEKYLSSYLISTNTITYEVTNLDEMVQVSQESPSNYFVYVGYTGNADIFKLEKKLKEIIDDYGLQDSFYYVDVTKRLEDKTLIKDLNDSFNTTDITNTPCILFYLNGKLEKVIVNDKGIFNTKDLTDLLTKYEYEKISQ